MLDKTMIVPPDTKVEVLKQNMNYEKLWIALKEELLKADKAQDIWTPQGTIIKMTEIEVMADKPLICFQTNYEPPNVKL